MALSAILMILIGKMHKTITVEIESKLLQLQLTALREVALRTCSSDTHSVTPFHLYAATLLAIAAKRRMRAKEQRRQQGGREKAGLRVATFFAPL
jgi:hypothetical protein